MGVIEPDETPGEEAEEEGEGRGAIPRISAMATAFEAEARRFDRKNFERAL